jgi:hypothetical protein
VRVRRKRPVAVAAGFIVFAAGCGGPGDGALTLKASVESIGNEMMALHEPRRGIEYHDRSGKPYWIAFVPPRSDAAALVSAGVPAGEPLQCRPADLASVAIGQADRTECVTFTQFTIPVLRVLHKSAGATVQMTLALDAKGYRLVEVR